MKDTKIEWCDHTFNPWWGCVRVSPGCEKCYAEAFAKRVGQKVWGVEAPRRFFGDKHWTEPLKWNAAAERDGERRRVFCASMADVFEDRDELIPHRDRLFELIAKTPWLDWLLLTKRPENIAKLWGATRPGPQWWPNIWVGTTAEDDRRARERIVHLVRVPAAVRFVSYEPALGPVDFFGTPDRPGIAMITRGGKQGYIPGEPDDYWQESESGIDWVIVGGESGPGARPFYIAWARSIVGQCKAAGVPVFVKQLGARPRDFYEGVTLVNGSFGHFDLGLSDKKGGDPSEWPEDLRVREFPEARRA